MEPATRKISVRIWTPLVEQLTARTDSACLRRDAYLTKVLEDEIGVLEREVGNSNSDAARAFIAAHLDTVPRKLVTLTLPEALVRKLDTLCEAKHLVRDSFFNRLFYLLTAEHRHLTRLFFDGDQRWVQDVMGRTDLSASAVGALLDPIPQYRNPFDTIRLGLHVARDRIAEESPTGAELWFAQHRTYSLTITDPRFGNGELYGLSIHLPDTVVPGTRDHLATVVLLDRLEARTEDHPK